MVDESPEDRATRRRRRLTFDAVPDLYEATRRGYPDELLDNLVQTAQLSRGSVVLEIGCGTGQLTGQLVPLGLAITAIDISPAMVTKARSVVNSDKVRFEASAFEDFDACGALFDVVVSATAFHWIDPEVAFVRTAALLRPDGWLALLGTGEAYDDPFGSSLRALWTGLSPNRQVGVTKPSDAQAAVASGLFGQPVTLDHDRRLTLPPEAVAGVERTRATVLDYPPDVRARYDRGLDALLENVHAISLTQRSSLTMVQRVDERETPRS